MKKQRIVLIVVCICVIVGILYALYAMHAQHAKHEHFAMCPFPQKLPNNDCDTICSNWGGSNITTSFSSPDLVDQKNCICIPESDINCTFDVKTLPAPPGTVIDIKYNDQNFIDLNMNRTWTQEALDDYFYTLSTTSTSQTLNNSFTDFIPGSRGYSKYSMQSNVNSVSDCMQLCENNNACKSFFYSNEMGCFQFPNLYSSNSDSDSDSKNKNKNKNKSNDTIRDGNGSPSSMTANKKISASIIPDTNGFTDLKSSSRGYAKNFNDDANAMNANDCMQSCASNDGCKSFYYSDENGCLKSQDFYFEGSTTRDATGSASSLTGNKKGTTNIPGYIHVSETSLTGGNNTIPNIDLNTCRLECDVLSNCKALYYKTQDQTCTLFNHSHLIRDYNKIDGVAGIKQMMPPNLGNYRNIGVGRVVPYTDSTHSIVMSKNVGSATDCAEICDANDACSSFYHGGDNSCAQYLNSTINQIGTTDDGDLFGVYADKNDNNFTNYIFNYTSDGTCQNFMVSDSNINSQLQNTYATNSKACFKTNNV